jgi:hypothetical protein
MHDLRDEITRVLQECETTLRTLAEQQRLSTGALDAFARLSQTVRQEMERRRNADRRAAARPGGDRRVANAALNEQVQEGEVVVALP